MFWPFRSHVAWSFDLQIEYGGTCHISGRPYTVFRWRPGNEARYKKTIICQDVAKAKNVCQVCLLDLDHNLPVQVRDKALGLEEETLPESAPGKEFALNRMAEEGELDDRSKFSGNGSNDILNKLRRSQPYYKRNQARICSFFVKGECKRGAECPYRHEMPKSGPLANQNIKDRYYGVNDPVANAMLARAEAMKNLTPPADPNIMTLYVGGINQNISEEDLRDVFYPYGEIKSIKKIDKRNCAFVTYTSRDAAERAASRLANQLVVKGEKLRLMWGKPQNSKDGTQTEGRIDSESAQNGKSFASLPQDRQSAHMYPSMDPLQAGARQYVSEKRPPSSGDSIGKSKRPRPPPGDPPAPPPPQKGQEVV